MPRGSSPNSKANMKMAYGGKGGFDSEGARYARKKQAEQARELKTLQQLDRENTTNEERIQILEKIKLMAMRGNLRAAELYLKFTGQSQPQNVIVSVVNQETEDALRKAIESRRGKGAE